MALLIAPERSTLSDASVPLINAWSYVISEPIQLAEKINTWSLDKESYYAIRGQEFNDPAWRAAQFIYLNKGAFNGLYRVNLAGKFNVPWGAPKTSRVYDLDIFTAISTLFADSKHRIRVQDFGKSFASSKEGDFVFADPPYVTVRSNRSFYHYNEALFSWNDQKRLARVAESARRRGVKVLVTNADHFAVRDLYPNFDCIPMRRKSTLAADSAARRIASEALFVSRPV